MFPIKKDLIIKAILRWLDQNLLGTGLWQSNKSENRQFGLKQSQQMPQNWRRCAIELIRIWIHCLLDFCSISSLCWSNCRHFSSRAESRHKTECSVNHDQRTSRILRVNVNAAKALGCLASFWGGAVWALERQKVFVCHDLRQRKKAKKEIVLIRIGKAQICAWKPPICHETKPQMVSIWRQLNAEVKWPNGSILSLVL